MPHAMMNGRGQQTEMAYHKMLANFPCWCGSGKKYKKCHESFDEKISAAERAGHPVPSRKLLKSAKVTVVRAFAQVSDCGEQGVTIQADGETYEAKSLIVAAGSKPAIPPIPGADRAGVFTSDDLLEGAGKELASLVIIGGGVIGCECASIYADLGAQVTILEAMDHILPPMDRELAQRLTMFLKKRGVSIRGQ